MSRRLKPERDYLLKLPVFKKAIINRGTVNEAEVTTADGRVTRTRYKYGRLRRWLRR